MTYTLEINNGTIVDYRTDSTAIVVFEGTKANVTTDHDCTIILVVQMEDGIYEIKQTLES